MVRREAVKQSETESRVARSAWQPMMLRWVGDVGSVTAKKSGVRTTRPVRQQRNKG